MTKQIYLALTALIFITSCQKDEVQNTQSSLLKKIEESPKDLEYDDILKIVLEHDHLFTQYKLSEEEKLVNDISEFITINTSLEAEKHHDLPETRTIYLRKIVSEQSGEKDGFTVSFVDIPSDRVAKNKQCESRSKNACDAAAILETIKAIRSEKRAVDVSFTRGDCRTISWIYLDCANNF